MSIGPESVIGNFTSSFVTDLLTGNVDNAAKAFMMEPEYSTLTHVAHAGEAIFAHKGSHIASSLASLSELFAGSTGAEVTQLTAADVHSGVSGTVVVHVSTPSSIQVLQLVVLLEQFVEDSFFVRSMTFNILSVVPVEPIVAAAEEPVAAPVEEAAAAEPAAPTVVVEEPVVVAAEEPAAAKPKKGKGKGKKAEEVAEVAAAPAPVEAAPVAAVEAEVAAPAPPVEVAAPVVEKRAESPAPPAATGAKSWATLASQKPQAVAAPKAVVRVAPPTKEEPVVEAAPAKKAAPARPAPRYEGTGDKLVFTVNVAVTDDQIYAALGKWAKSVVSLRNVSAAHQRVFADFSVEGVLEDIKDKVTIGGQKTPVFRQKPKE